VAYCSNIRHRYSTSFWAGEGGLRATYDIHLMLIEKRIAGLFARYYG